MEKENAVFPDWALERLRAALPSHVRDALAPAAIDRGNAEGASGVLWDSGLQDMLEKEMLAPHLTREDMASLMQARRGMRALAAKTTEEAMRKQLHQDFRRPGSAEPLPLVAFMEELWAFLQDAKERDALSPQIEAVVKRFWHMAYEFCGVVGRQLKLHAADRIVYLPAFDAIRSFGIFSSVSAGLQTDTTNGKWGVWCEAPRVCHATSGKDLFVIPSFDDPRGRDGTLATAMMLVPTPSNMARSGLHAMAVPEVAACFKTKLNTRMRSDGTTLTLRLALAAKLPRDKCNIIDIGLKGPDEARATLSAPESGAPRASHVDLVLPTDGEAHVSIVYETSFTTCRVRWLQYHRFSLKRRDDGTVSVAADMSIAATQFTVSTIFAPYDGRPHSILGWSASFTDILNDAERHLPADSGFLSALQTFERQYCTPRTADPVLDHEVDVFAPFDVRAVQRKPRDWSPSDGIWNNLEDIPYVVALHYPSAATMPPSLRRAFFQNIFHYWINFLDQGPTPNKTIAFRCAACNTHAVAFADVARPAAPVFYCRACCPSH